MTTRELIELEQTIDADPDIIWEACSTPRGLERWQADEVEGDVVPGRILTLHFAAFDTTIELEVLDVVPGESVRMRSGTSIVEWIVGPNKITLRHTDTEPSEDPEGLAASWRLALVQLAHALEKHPYQARQVTWVVREASTSAEQAHAFFSDRTALNLWLTSEGEIGGTGSEYQIRLKNGETLSGEVLSNDVGRDVALSCREYNDALLVLRTLPSQNSEQDRLVCIVWSDWGLSDEVADVIASRFEEAVERLGHLLENTGRA